jgi:hypothetical protein
MQIMFVRRPQSGGSFSQRKELDGSLRAVTGSDGMFENLEIGFSTDAAQNNSYFYAVISPRRFKELASQMMKAHSQEAIKAFGAAMQEVPEISRLRPP